MAREKDYAPPEVRPILVIDASQYDQIQFMIGARFTMYDLVGFGSEWRTDAILGSEHALISELYKPWGARLQWFVAPKVFFENAQQNFFSQGNLLAEYRNRQAGGSFDFGFVRTRQNEWRLGYRAAYQKLYPTVGELAYGTLAGRVGTTSLRFQHDGRNDPVIPTQGTDVLFNTSWYDANPGAHSGFPLSALRTTRFFPVKKASSIYFNGVGGTTFTYHKTGFPPFDVGGGPDLWAYGKNEFQTNQYFLFKGGYIHPLWDLPPLIGDRVYVVAGAEAGKLYDLPPGESTLPGDFTASFVMNTIFGPIQFGGAAGATGHYKFFYSIGRVF
jgi:NTE family protein